MDKMDCYLKEVLRVTFLRREEKAEWREEMRTHIDCSVEEQVSDGFSREDALELTLRQFGDPGMLRRDLTRQTYGVSIDVLLPVSVLFLGWYAYAVAEELQVHFSGQGIGVVPLTLLAGTLSLLLTRKTADRWAVLLTLLPFGLVFGLQKLQVPGALSWYYGVLLGDRWGSYSGYAGIMILLGLLIFLKTQNGRIASLPLLLPVLYSAHQLPGRISNYMYHLQYSSPNEHEMYYMAVTYQLDSLLIRTFVWVVFLLALRYFTQFVHHRRINKAGS
ncbi:permease prefix domain 1-containing protein [Paenibacillus caseinilyticus]|uniref:ABC transporter permease n=1 Tax=Paenibacillus mucilaginosus K02 TaxID=997761 RepID=I0BHE8_9BACL|nr:permease prefix domain 1-containing protein [Paenibacillus mucilaginosus]AFH61795.1 hypothetical protein B2K_13895 [Paenibacillus mucilaginosus K02]